MPPPPGGHTLPAGRTQGPEGGGLGERRKWAGPSRAQPPFSLSAAGSVPLAWWRLPGSGVIKRGRKERGLKDPIKRNLPEEGMGIRLQGELPYMIV